MDEIANQQPPATGFPHSPDTPRPSISTRVKILIIVGPILLVLIGLGVGLFVVKMNAQQVVVPTASVSPTPEISVMPSVMEPTTAQETTPVPQADGTETFISTTLGIQFSYLKEQPYNAGSIQTAEVGNKVYVYPSSFNQEDGQSVEVFQKQADETIQDAIQKQFLQGKEQGKCFVTITETSGTISKAIIDFPTAQDEGMDTMYEKTTYCSEDYAKTNGIRYFWYDSSHPTTFLFFSIGQYGITAAGDKPWQDTIEVTK